MSDPDYTALTLLVAGWRPAQLEPQTITCRDGLRRWTRSPGAVLLALVKAGVGVFGDSERGYIGQVVPLDRDHVVANDPDPVVAALLAYVEAKEPA